MSQGSLGPVMKCQTSPCASPTNRLGKLKTRSGMGCRLWTHRERSAKLRTRQECRAELVTQESEHVVTFASFSIDDPRPAGARSSLTVSRTGSRGRGGVVSGKMAQAVKAGAEMLAGGGNAIDAAVTTAFAMGVAEPWMNGIGGGGFLVAWLANERRSIAIEYPMISPAGANPDMFALVGGATDTGLFGWPATAGNANTVGHLSVTVPGTVAGLAMALERYGTRSLADVLAPAIALAEEGIPVTWHTTLTVARDLAFRQRATTVLAELGPTAFAVTALEQARPFLAFGTAVMLFPS